MEPAPTPLLKTKLFLPRQRPRWVSRPRLLMRLNQAWEEKRRLILVSAPPGFGKTGLLSEWVHRLLNAGSNPGARAGWLSLDPADNDPARFLTYLAAALEPALSDLGQALQPMMQAQPAASLQGTFVEMINALANRPEQPFVLVLDDYHLIQAEDIHENLAFFLENLPPGLQLVIATRADPPLPLARLRARALVCELRAADLRFTLDEAADFLNRSMGLGLEPKDLQALETHTEGWIAGLQLAAVALQSARTQDEDLETAEFVAAFTGSHRFILDYLVEEVLRRQPPAVKDFLLSTSILDRFSAPLCEAVLDPLSADLTNETAFPSRQRVQAILDYLEHSNLFLISLDHEHRWFRYHHLFADFLRNRLGSEAPEQTPELHRRAAGWYERNDMLPEAVEHSLLAQDFKAAARQIEIVAPITLMHSEMITLKGWIEVLPRQVRSERPRLMVYQAWALLVLGMTNDVYRLVQEIQALVTERALPPDPLLEGHLAAIGSIQALFQGDIAKTIELSQQSIARLADGDVFSRGVIAWLEGMTALMSGETRHSSQTFSNSIRDNQPVGNRLVVQLSAYILGFQQLMMGSLSQAERTFQGTIQQMETDASLRDLLVTGAIYCGMAEILRERNQLETAMTYLEKGVQFNQKWGIAEQVVDGLITQGRLEQAQGRVQAARRTFQQAHQFYLDDRISIWTKRQVLAHQARLFVQQGDLEAASLWRAGVSALAKKDVEPVQGFSEYLGTYVQSLEGVVMAYYDLQAGQAQAAEERLHTVLESNQSIDWRSCQIEAGILLALAFQAQGKQALARQALRNVLQEAAPESFIRLFLDQGQPMRSLLLAGYPGLSTTPLGRFVEQLLEAFDQEPAALSKPASASGSVGQTSASDQFVEPLSEREIEVLKLVVQGLSNTEIADRLVVALSTVKSHINHIYSKLGVSTRIQAADWARKARL